MVTREDKGRVEKTNPHYVIAGILCVTGVALLISVVGSFIGLPVLLLGLVWFAVARWTKSHEFENR